MTGETALVVEDNEQNLKLATALLELEGFRVLGATDAEDALGQLERIRPDVVLVDIQLPGMDGVELAHRIRGEARLAGLPLVALTAYAMKGDEHRFLREGFDAYIAKPIEPASFASRVRAMIEGARSRDERGG